MKTKANLKRHLTSVVIALIAILYITPIQAQTVRDHRDKGDDDPYTRLRTAANKKAVKKTKMDSVKITVNDPNWQEISKTKIEFVPFKLEDKDGNPISPNKRVALKNGKIITAQEYIDKLNQLEQKLNSKGFSLRDDGNQIVSKTITRQEDLDVRRASAPKSIGPLKKGADLKNFMSLEKKVGVVASFDNVRGKSITLKPYSMYTESEINEVNKYNFSKAKDGTISAKKLIVPRRFQKFKTERFANLSKIYEHKPKDNFENWKFGNDSTFMASIEGTLHRYAKIYPFDAEHPEKNKSEFNVSANGKVKGSVLNNSMDIINGTAEFNAPSDVSKKMTARIHFEFLETTIFNETMSFAQKKSISKTFTESFDNSFGFKVPIIPGIDLVFLIGVKGDVGFEFSGKIERTIASIEAKPIVNLTAYGSAGAEFVEIFGAGVDAELTFIKANLELQAYSGIFNQNSEEIVVGINHYFGYDINILSGKLDAYAEACTPDWIPIVGGKCKRFTHNIFEWDGFKASGTIDKDSIYAVLDNIAKYDEEPVMTKN